MRQMSVEKREQVLRIATDKAFGLRNKVQDAVSDIEAATYTSKEDKANAKAFIKRGTTFIKNLDKATAF